MSLRVAVAGEVKGEDACSRSESEYEECAESSAADAKPGDLPVPRLKSR